MGECMAKRLAMMLAAAVLALGIGEYAGSRPALASGFCTCCLDPMPEACGTACAARQTTPGQCPAFVIFEGGKGAVGVTGNPLNAMSLKELDIGKPRRTELEGFRKFLEKYRIKAIAEWRAAEQAPITAASLPRTPSNRQARSIATRSSAITTASGLTAKTSTPRRSEAYS